jgi:hypothetical protein
LFFAKGMLVRIALSLALHATAHLTLGTWAGSMGHALLLDLAIEVVVELLTRGG